MVGNTHQGCGCCVLTDLVLCSFDPGLQVSRGMEVLALVSAAAAFNVVHADNDRVLTAVHHAGLQGVSVAAVTLSPRAVTALKFSTNLTRHVGAPINIYLFTHHTLAKLRNNTATASSLHTSSLSVRTCFCVEVPLPMAARPVGLPGTSRGVLGSSSGIKLMPGPMWLRYGLNAILGLVAIEGDTENDV